MLTDDFIEKNYKARKVSVSQNGKTQKFTCIPTFNVETFTEETCVNIMQYIYRVRQILSFETLCDMQKNFIPGKLFDKKGNEIKFSDYVDLANGAVLPCYLRQIDAQRVGMDEHQGLAAVKCKEKVVSFV